MNDASTVLLFVRVGFSLAIVLGLIWIAARVAKRRGKIAARQSDVTVDVVARRQIGRRGSVVVVESSGRRFLVGVTDDRIDLLAELGSDEVASIEVTAGRTVVASPVALPAEPTVDLPPLQLAVGDDPTAPRRESLVDTLRDLTVRR